MPVAHVYYVAMNNRSVLPVLSLFISVHSESVTFQHYILIWTALLPQCQYSEAMMMILLMAFSAQYIEARGGE